VVFGVVRRFGYRHDRKRTLVLSLIGGIAITSDSGGTRVTRSQALFASWVTDVLLYIVILNLFVQYVPKVITESFTISIFTAVVLKLLIEVIARLEHRTRGWFDQREGRVWRALRAATMFSILFLSKFVVLEVIDIIFGDRVSLGGFIEVVVLVLSLILARLGVRWVYDRLGERGST
jgi:hypothetical protein